MNWQGEGKLPSKGPALLGLTGPSKIFFQTTFHMKLPSLMTDSRSKLMRKTILFYVTFIVIKIPRYSKLNMSEMN